MSTEMAPAAPGVVPEVPDGGGVSLGLQMVLGRVASVQERIAATLDAMAAKRALLPVAIPQVAVGFVVAGTPTLMDMGGPQQGRQWTIRRWAIGAGDAVATAVAGATAADLFIGRPMGTTGTTGAVHQWAWRVSAVPSIVAFTDEQIVVYASDRVFATVTGATTVGQQIMSVVSILDEPVAEYTASISV